MALLQMTKSLCHGDVDEAVSLLVEKHQIGHEALELGISYSETEVEVTIPVQVAEVRSHGQHRKIEPLGAGDVLEAAAALTAIEVGLFIVGRNSLAMG